MRTVIMVYIIIAILGFVAGVILLCRTMYKSISKRHTENTPGIVIFPVYVRRTEDYLRLEMVRDVIELPINDVLDINGWDLQKTLKLLYKSNPTLFEWFSSPIVYKETEFAGKFRDLMIHFFSSRKIHVHGAVAAMHDNSDHFSFLSPVGSYVL